ncbi:mCG1036191 [Mus musculus]|nr:mCG1036191 [Mus musculus]
MSKGRRIFPSCSAMAAQGCSGGSALRPHKSAKELSPSLSLVAGAPPAFSPESPKSPWLPLTEKLFAELTHGVPIRQETKVEAGCGGG